MFVNVSSTALSSSSHVPFVGYSVLAYYSFSNVAMVDKKFVLSQNPRYCDKSGTLVFRTVLRAIILAKFDETSMVFAKGSSSKHVILSIF